MSFIINPYEKAAAKNLIDTWDTMSLIPQDPVLRPGIRLEGCICPL